MRIALSAITATLLAALPATASPIFSDNFNGENVGSGSSYIGLNYTGFANWMVSSGTVDLIGDGTPYEYLPVGNGNGLYVDLDGTTNNAGILSTNLVFGSGSYQVEFDLAGSQVSGRPDDSVTVSLGNWTTTLANIPSNFPLTHYSFTFSTPTSGSLSFSNAGGDNVGALLDNVSVTATAVPEPATLAVFGGIALAGAVGYRRRKATATV